MLGYPDKINLSSNLSNTYQKIYGAKLLDF